MLRNPTTGIAACCAHAASGHAAAPPSSVMNSRRLICAPSAEDRTLPHRPRKSRVMHHSKFGSQCLSWVGLGGPATSDVCFYPQHLPRSRRAAIGNRGGDREQIQNRAFCGINRSPARREARRIGMLMGYAESDPEAKGFFAGFTQRLAEAGSPDPDQHVFPSILRPPSAGCWRLAFRTRFVRGYLIVQVDR